MEGSPQAESPRSKRSRLGRVVRWGLLVLLVCGGVVIGRSVMLSKAYERVKLGMSPGQVMWTMGPAQKRGRTTTQFPHEPEIETSPYAEAGTASTIPVGSAVWHWSILWDDYGVAFDKDGKVIYKWWLGFD